MRKVWAKKNLKKRMGVLLKDFGEVQPICNDCGVALCWSVDEFEYLQWKDFWDNWTCKDCNINYKEAFKNYKLTHKPFDWIDKN